MNFTLALTILTLGMVTFFTTVAVNIKEQHALMQQGVESYVESQQNVKFAKTTENYRRPAIIAGTTDK